MSSFQFLSITDRYPSNAALADEARPAADEMGETYGR
jgi:hypothetical protein